MQTLDHANTDGEVIFRKPVREDGAAIFELIRECKPLDENSLYCNLLQSDHFRDTCIVAELDGKVVGWVSAYIIPADPESVFVWQVAVSSTARGIGLGTRMLAALMEREECIAVKRMQTTITLDNDASWALFRRFAEKNNGDLTSDAHFTRHMHFAGEHATEHMVTITFREAVMSAA